MKLCSGSCIFIFGENFDSMFTQKKDLIELRKIICLKDFLRFEEMIYLNKIKFVSFKQNFCLKSNKLYL